MSPISAFLISLAALPAVLGIPTKLFPRAVDPETLNRLNLFEQWSAAAYCPNNYETAGNKVTCDTGNCPMVEADDTHTVAVFSNSNGTGATGFVAVDNTNDQIVASFRGSDSVSDFLTDFDFPLTPAPDVCAACEAEMGFYDAWESVKSIVVSAVTSSAATYPSYEIVATGHSLGAAVATLAAAVLRNQNYTVDLFTYGSPRVGDPTFAEYVSNQQGESYRVTHTNDPVPKVPPSQIGYEHVYGQYWITSGNGVPVTEADIQVFAGDADMEGNEATNSSDIASHLWYFNSVAACAPEGFGV